MSTPRSRRLAHRGGSARCRRRDRRRRRLAARRRVEARVLFARGASPGAFGARASLEAVLPVFVGALAGLGLAVALTILVGPGRSRAPPSRPPPGRPSLVVPAAAALIGLISAVLVLGSERRSRGSLRHVFVPWELLVLVAAAVFLYLLTRGAFGEAEGDEVGTPEPRDPPLPTPLHRGLCRPRGPGVAPAAVRAFSRARRVTGVVSRRASTRVRRAIGVLARRVDRGLSRHVRVRAGGGALAGGDGRGEAASSWAATSPGAPTTTARSTTASRCRRPR